MLPLWNHVYQFADVLGFLSDTRQQNLRPLRMHKANAIPNKSSLRYTDAGFRAGCGALHRPENAPGSNERQQSSMFRSFDFCIFIFAN